MNTDNILVNLIIVFKRNQLLKFVIILKTRTNYFIRVISFFMLNLCYIYVGCEFMKKETISTKRNTNIEILRIIAILLIVISHYSVHNVTNVNELSFSINKILLQMMTLGNIGSELFMLITGYYLINSSKIKLSKLFRLWLQIIFYSVGVYILFVLLDLEPFSYTTFIKNFFPITFNEYWFASVYFIVYLFHPYINTMLKNLTQKDFIKLISLSLLIFSILNFITGQQYYFNELIQLIIIYVIGTYYGKYDDIYLDENKSKKLLIICLLILTLSTIGLEFLNNKVSIKFIDYLYSRNSLIVVMISISLFNIFKNKKEFSNKFINSLSSCTFGVYLLTETPILKNYLWKNIFDNSNYIYSSNLIIHTLISVLLTIVVSIIIEIIRKATMELFYNKFVSKKIDIVSKKLNNSYLKLVNNFVK